MDKQCIYSIYAIVQNILNVVATTDNGESLSKYVVI